MDTVRLLWAGERLPSATEGLPPIQPMFAPPHRIPLYVAAYRKEFVALAGQKADGYLARPAESIPSLRGILERLAAAATEAGRDPRAIESTGYLLSLVDETRREALNRAKREPFVIYMMSVLGDVSLRRAGFELELRDRIAAAWRAEDFHEAGKLIPDELLDAFMLCGTREDVAAGAARFQDEAGLELPLLQPVVQEEDADHASCCAAARLYGESRSTEAAASGAGARRRPWSRPAWPTIASWAPGSRTRRRLGAAWEVLRPVLLHGLDHPGAGGRGAGLGGRPLRPRALPARAGRGRAAPRRHQRRQRGLRRPQGHRHHHLAARQPRHPQGPHQRARRAAPRPMPSSPAPSSSASP